MADLMNDAVMRMLEKYERRRVEDDVRAFREILQEFALLGLWRSRFFEKAAFYGGTALRNHRELNRRHSARPGAEDQN